MDPSTTAERTFGDWLRQRRRALDLTQEELARQVGCSIITLRKLEAEERRPSKPMSERLADVLNVPPSERAEFLRFARGDPFAGPRTSPAANETTAPQPARHNLPLQLTSFIGREKEISEVGQLLARARLVTLTGTGGAGKTRLALEVAAGLVNASAFSDGVWLVELAPLADPALVPHTIAAVLGVREVPGRPIVDSLLDHIRPRRLLLLLDNCEHLIQACAALAATLLRASPQLAILTTSREALTIGGERVYPVPALSLPDPTQIQSIETLAKSEALRLFAARAEAVLPGFALIGDNASAVYEICRQLDGLPLEIELASARVKIMRVDQIAARLAEHGRFRLLTAGTRTDLPRHQTLQALIDWSYDLLSAPEQILLRRLAVFAGGCQLDLAQAVCASESLALDDVFDLLVQLVNKSLVVAQIAPEGETRYRLLETIRQYALAKLAASGEADKVLERLAAHLIGLDAMFRSSDYLPSEIDRLETEIDNLRAALAWSLSSAGSVKLGLQLAAVMYQQSFLRGRWTESRRWLEAVLARADAEGGENPRQRARALDALGNMVALQGDFAGGEALLSRSLQLYQELGEVRVSAAVLRRLGTFALERGDDVTARQRIEQSLEQFRGLGDQAGIANASLTLGAVATSQGDTQWATTLLEGALAYFRAHDYPHSTAWALNHLGHVAQIEGDYARAQRLHEESLPGFQRYGGEKSPIAAEAFQSLGETRLAQGDPAGARAHLAQALAQYQEMGDRKGISWCLAGLAGVAVIDDEPQRAARLWGAGEALRQSLGGRYAPAARATHERLMATAREQLGEGAFNAAWAEGARMTMEQAVVVGLSVETSG